MKTDTISKWRFQLLLVTLLSLYAVVPFTKSRWLYDLVMTAILIFAVSSVIEKRGRVVVFSMLAGFAIIGTWYAHWFPSDSNAIVVRLLDSLFMVLIVGTILAHVFKSTYVTRETVTGAICAYLLIGTVWAHAFSILENMSPGSFADNLVAMKAAAGPESMRDQSDRFTYFSLVTLTTLGYGDITPLTRPARNLAALEAVLGQLYLAVLIARLVGKQASWGKERED